MKKSKIFVISIFTLLNIPLIGLILEATMKLLWLWAYIGYFLRFTLVCATFFIIALLGIVVLAIFNSKLNKKIGITKRMWCIQYILSLILAIPTLYAWEKLFDFIHFYFYQF